jgi:hypothetical protein
MIGKTATGWSVEQTNESQSFSGSRAAIAPMAMVHLGGLRNGSTTGSAEHRRETCEVPRREEIPKVVAIQAHGYDEN